MNIKGVLFDFDGVIIKSMELHLIAWQHAFARYNVNISKLELYNLEGRGVKAVAKILAEKYNINPLHIPEIIEIKIRHYDMIFKPEFYDGIFQLLDLIKNYNIKMAIVSGSIKNRITSFIDQYFNDYFSAIVSSDDVINTKPSPEPYFKGAELLGLKPDECIIVENAPEGIRSGKSANMMVFAVQTTLEEKHLTEADYIVRDFPELHKLLIKNLHSLRE